MKIQELLQINKHTDFNTYSKLLILQDMGSYLFPNLSFDDMKLQGYCDFELKLTKKGEDLLNLCMSKKIDSIIDFNKLHQTLQNELFQLTGKKQKVINKKYSFLCNSTDLKTRLLKVSKKYNLTDWNKIEKLLLQHIYNSHKANWEFITLLEYYIEKNGGSKLATDYSHEEVKEEYKKEEELQPKEVKNLF